MNRATLKKKKKKCSSAELYCLTQWRVQTRTARKQNESQEEILHFDFLTGPVYQSFTKHSNVPAAK